LNAIFEDKLKEALVRLSFDLAKGNDEELVRLVENQKKEVVRVAKGNDEELVRLVENQKKEVVRVGNYVIVKSKNFNTVVVLEDGPLDQLINVMFALFGPLWSVVFGEEYEEARKKIKEALEVELIS